MQYKFLYLSALVFLVAACGGDANNGDHAQRTQMANEAEVICGALNAASDGSQNTLLETLLASAQNRGINSDALIQAVAQTCPGTVTSFVARSTPAPAQPPASTPQTPTAPPPSAPPVPAPSAPQESSGSSRQFPTVTLGTEIVCQNFGTIWDPCTVLEIRVIEDCDAYVRFGEPIVIAFRIRGTLAAVGSLDETSGTQIPFNMYPRVHGGDGVVYERGISYFDTCVPEPRAPRLPKIVRTGITQEAWYGIPVTSEAVDGFKLMLGYTFWE